MRDDRETILVEKRIAKTKKIAIKKVLNERRARAPIEVATPFPPLKDRKGEKICPVTANRADNDQKNCSLKRYFARRTVITPFEASSRRTRIP